MFTLKQAYNSIVYVAFLLLTLHHTSQAQWTPATSGTTQYLYNAKFNGSLWVAVGEGGTILTSTNGTTWTARQSGITNTLWGVSYDGSRWVVVGGSQFPFPETSNILTSPDGINWTSQTSPTTHPYLGINYGGGKFVAVSASGDISTSTDGSTWTNLSLVINRFYSTVYNGSLWVVVGASGAIVTSPDATTWALRTSGVTNGLFSVNYGGGLFVAVGFTGKILTSSDGITWTSRTSGTTETLQAVSYANGLWVAVGASGKIFTSSDAITWKPSSSGTGESLWGVSYGGGVWVVTGASGQILYSANPLPVSLTSFAGKAVDSEAQLTWHTSWETGASHFLVERSSNAKSFEAIGRVNAQGTTTLGQTYGFVDENLRPGVWYYRLRQVDLDGSYTYSQIIGVRIGAEPLDNLTIYPNPGSKELTLENKQGLSDISIYSVTGELLRQQTFEKPVSRWTWDAGNQPFGTYLIQVKEADGTNRTQRWVKQ